LEYGDPAARFGMVRSAGFVFRRNTLDFGPDLRRAPN
jgi:hypothetical protein